MVGRNIIEIIVPDGLLGEAQSILAGLRAGESWTGSFSALHKDGTTVRALVRNRSVVDDDGRTIGIVGESRLLDEPDPGDAEPDHLAARVAAEVAARLAGLQAVTAALARAVDQAEVAEAVFRHGLRDLGGHTGSLCLVEPGGTTVAIVHEIGYSKAVKESWATFPLDADLPASECIRTGDLVLTRSRAELEARFPIFDGTPLVGDHAHAIIPLPDEDGTVFGALVVGFSDAREFDDQDIAILRALGAQCAGALRRAELFEATRAAVEAEQAARRAAEEAHRSLAFLAEASATLGSSLDYERTLARVVDLAVPRLADWCAVFVAAADGSIRRLALAHADPERVELVRRLLDRYPPDPDAPAKRRVRHPHRPVRARPGDRRRAAGEDDHRSRAAGAGAGRRPGLHRHPPPPAGGRVLGALVLATDRGRPLADSSLALGVDLAVRAGVAIDNSMLFAERTRIARQLQASLLPARLPAIPGLDVGARLRRRRPVGGGRGRLLRRLRPRPRPVGGGGGRRPGQGGGGGRRHRPHPPHHPLRVRSTSTPPATCSRHLNEVLLRGEADRPAAESDDPAEAWARDEPRFCTVGPGRARAGARRRAGDGLRRRPSPSPRGPGRRDG